MRQWIIKVLLRGVKDDDVRNQILTEAVKHLFNTISEDDILQTGNQWTLRGKPISEGEVKQLQEEAKLITELKLWRILQLELKYQANKAIYENSKDLVDIMAGKILLYYIDIIRTKLNKLCS